MLHMRLLSLLLSIFFISPLAHADLNSDTFNYYDELLKEYVSTGTRDDISTTLVDYRAWGADTRHKQAMVQLTNADPLKLESVEETLAFWINAYNLLTIDLIVQKAEQQSIRNLGGLFGNPWDNFEWQIGPKTYTLNNIEHAILRSLDEPRIHFALNCASLSCPDLAPHAYQSDKIYSTLEIKAKAFLENPTKGLHVTSKGGTSFVTLSQIFKWYRDDFSSIERFVTTYTGLKNIYIDGYMRYNWNLNKKD